jgi:predicted DCC family thiol-disulfide oxidoreductase YuxK
MSDIDPNTLYLIYDGDCIMCRSCARAIKLKQSVGQFITINARIPNPIVDAVNERGYDLNTGIVVIYKQQYYHGKDAVSMLALLSSKVNWFNKLAAVIFKYKQLTSILYPVFRAIRNCILWLRNIPKITMPISTSFYDSIFAYQKETVAQVFQKRYRNHYFSSDKTIMHGKLDINFTRAFRILLPLYKLTGTLVPYEGADVPTDVSLSSATNSRIITMLREFKFKNHKTCYFKSKLLHYKKDIFLELTAGKIAWKFKFKYHNDKLIMQHIGYGLYVCNRCLPIPFLSLLIGKPYAEETAIDDSNFAMSLILQHPLLGKLFTYKGKFTIMDVCDAE